jgi:hypothetical protein
VPYGEVFYLSLSVAVQVMDRQAEHLLEPVAVYYFSFRLILANCAKSFKKEKCMASRTREAKGADGA